MHVKRIHDMMEKLTKCAEMELEKGVENVDAKEMGEVVDIIKDLAEAEYYAKISKAMDEAEYGEDYDYKGAYDDGRRGYRGRSRDSMGRFTSRSGRRGYDEPMDYDMMPEWYRDMDREHGKMYYTEGGNMGGGLSGGMSGGGNRGYSEGEGGQYSSRMQRDGMGESRYDKAKRGYEETKAMHKSGTAEDKQITMKEAEKMINVIFDEIDEMLEDAPQELKSMIKTKGMAKMQKIN